MRNPGIVLCVFLLAAGANASRASWLTWLRPDKVESLHGDSLLDRLLRLSSLKFGLHLLSLGVSVTGRYPVFVGVTGGVPVQ